MSAPAAGARIGSLPLHLRIIEPSAGGHRLRYVRLLAERAPAASVEWITTRAAASSREAGIHLSELTSQGRLAITVLPRWSAHRALETAARASERRPSTRLVVAIPDGDRWLPQLGLMAVTRPRLFGQAHWNVLLMRPPDPPRFRGSGATTLRTKAKAAMSEGVAAIGRRTNWIDVYSLDDAFGFETSPSSRLAGLKDPVDAPRARSRTLARSELGLPEKGSIVGLIGAMDVRKNPGLVARGSAAVLTGADDRLLLAGRLGHGVAEQVEHSGLGTNHVVRRAGYLSDDELIDCVSSCDVLALMYSNHNSASGMMALAAACGVPVLVPAGTKLADLACGLGFGVAVRTEQSAVSDGIRQALKTHDALATAALEAARALEVNSYVDSLSNDPREAPIEIRAGR